MENEFPEAGRRRGLSITWARGIVEDAFQVDPGYMEQAAVAILGHPAWCWTADSTTDEKLHAICRAAMLVRMAATYY